MSKQTELAQLADAVAVDGGNVGLDGIYLGGTVAANLLDDYEEGTWTPGFTAGTVSIVSGSTRYIKVGRSVTCWARVNTFSDTTSSNNVQLEGLPFSRIGAELHVGDAWGNAVGSNRSLFWYGPVGGGTTAVAYYGDAATGSYGAVTHSNFSSGTVLILRLHYISS